MVGKWVNGDELYTSGGLYGRSKVSKVGSTKVPRYPDFRDNIPPWPIKVNTYLFNKEN